MSGLIPHDGRRVTLPHGLDVTDEDIGTLRERSTFTMTGMFIRNVEAGDQLRLMVGHTAVGWATVEAVDIEKGTMTLVRS